MDFDAILIEPRREAMVRAGHWRDKTVNDYFDAVLAEKPDALALSAIGVGGTVRRLAGARAAWQPAARDLGQRHRPPYERGVQASPRSIDTRVEPLDPHRGPGRPDGEQDEHHEGEYQPEHGSTVLVPAADQRCWC